MSDSQKPAGAIFDAALQLPEAEWAAYLEAACAGDGQLRQRVETLLGAHQAAGKFMDSPALASMPEGVVSNLTEQPGDKIGRYKLLQQIGEGGCGVVYMAEQEEPVRRRVAVKVIKLGMDTKQVIARFEAERQALALMDHPNIARVFDAGATQTGRPYFVMELIKGIPITRYCDDHNLSTVTRLGLFVQVCQAIQHAHQKGIIHRDIKPSNVLVADHDGVPVPKIIDFGIAKATTDQRLTDKTLFTAFEQFMGTAAYMSPEQARLSGLDTDTRSDIYSLGVLLYELLTGGTPFEAKRLLEAGLDEVRRIIREEEPVPPSTKLDTLSASEQTTVAKHRQSDPPKLVHLLSGDLDWIVMKALEKERGRRYETANGLAMDIQRHLNNEPVLARPTGKFYQFQKLVRRNKLVFAAGTAVGSVVMIGFVASTWSLLKEKQARQRAVIAERAQNASRAEAEIARANEAKQRDQAQTEAGKSRQVAQFLEDMLKGVGPSVALGRDTTLLREILDKTGERVGRDLMNQAAVEIELRTILAEAYLDLEALNQAESHAHEGLERARSLFGEDHLATARLLVDLGFARYRLGVNEQALALMREGCAVQRKLFPGGHLDLANSLDRIAELLRRYDQTDEAETLQREALAMKRRLLGNENPALIPSLNNLGWLLLGPGTLPEAESVTKEALKLHQNLQGKEEPDTAISYRVLGEVYSHEGRLPESEAMFREALGIQRRLLGTEHSQVAWTLNYLAQVLFKENKLGQGAAAFREALAMRSKLSIPDVNLISGNFESVLWNVGDLSGLESYYREQLAVTRTALTNGAPEETPLAGVMLHHLANVLRAQGKSADARTFGEKAAAMYLRHADWPTNERQHAFEVLAEVLRVLGDSAGAEALCRTELQRMRDLFPANDSQLARSIALLVDDLLAQEKFTEAEPLARECLAIGEKTRSEDWRTFKSRSALGAILLGQRKYADAEPLLLSGYEGIKQRKDNNISFIVNPRLKESLQRLEQLYGATGRTEKAAEWEQRLAEFESAETANHAPINFSR